MMGKSVEIQVNNQREFQNNPTKVQRKPIKVKYISSPMMIKASNALEFRAIVQQLTGFNSDDAPIRRRLDKPPADADDSRTSSSTLHAHEMEVVKFSDDMSSFLELDERCFARQNLPKNYMGFQSPCLFQ